MKSTTASSRGYATEILTTLVHDLSNLLFRSHDRSVSTRPDILLLALIHPLLSRYITHAHNHVIMRYFPHSVLTDVREADTSALSPNSEDIKIDVARIDCSILFR